MDCAEETRSPSKDHAFHKEIFIYDTEGLSGLFHSAVLKTKPRVAEEGDGEGSVTSRTSLHNGP